MKLTSQAYRQIAVICVMVYSSLGCYAQFNVHAEYFTTSDTIFNAQKKQKNTKQCRDVIFVNNDGVTNNGVSIDLKRESDNRYTGIIPFPEPKKNNLDSLYLIATFHTQNVKRLNISLQSTDGQKIKTKPIEVKDQGYSTIFYRLSEIVYNDSTRTDSIADNAEITITGIDISAETGNEKYELVFSELILCKLRLTRSNYYHPFFEPISKGCNIWNISKSSLSNSCQTTFITSTFAEYASAGSPNINITTNDSLYNKLGLFKTIIDQTIEWYPFYKERGIDKEDVKKQVAKAYIEDGDYASTIERIKSILASFGDPHLFIEQSEKINTRKSRQFPLALHEIANEYYIAAVFDTLLAKKIRVEDKIIEIDGQSVADLVKTSTPYYSGSLDTKRSKAISKLVGHVEKDTVAIKVTNRDYDTIAVKIAYRERLQIPTNFKPKPFDFREVGKGIFYYQLTNIDNAGLSNLLNHIKDASSGSSFIIDLRNNGGGNGGLVPFVISTFIKQPQALNVNSLPAIKGSRETVVINPNKTVHFSSFPIAILVNNRTACASEFLAHTLQVYTGATIIGDGNTAGAFANMYVVTLPDGHKLHLNCLVKTDFYQKTSIENTGIEPDILVWNNRISQLYPYDDKVLDTAVQYLKEVKQIKKEKLRQ